MSPMISFRVATRRSVRFILWGCLIVLGPWLLLSAKNASAEGRISSAQYTYLGRTQTVANVPYVSWTVDYCLIGDSSDALRARPVQVRLNVPSFERLPKQIEPPALDGQLVAPHEPLDARSPTCSVMAVHLRADLAAANEPFADGNAQLILEAADVRREYQRVRIQPKPVQPKR